MADRLHCGGRSVADCANLSHKEIAGLVTRLFYSPHPHGRDSQSQDVTLKPATIPPTPAWARHCVSKDLPPNPPPISRTLRVLMSVRVSRETRHAAWSWRHRECPTCTLR